MQPLYTEEEFKDAKSRQPLPLKCLHCHNTFYKSKNQIQADVRHSKRRTGDFCSISCKNQNYRNGHLCHTICDQCHKPFKKFLCNIKATKHNFCCQSCAAKWYNAHKTKGTRISKLEVWLSKKLPKFYPSLEFHFNQTDAINAELDIFIPSLKLAFELNGIFHYEPIYGPEKLASMQTNDARKAQACLERGIELCIIDVSHQIYFKEQSSMKFLNIIKNIVDSKLES